MVPFGKSGQFIIIIFCFLNNLKGLYLFYIANQMDTLYSFGTTQKQSTKSMFNFFIVKNAPFRTMHSLRGNSTVIIITFSGWNILDRP